MTVDFHVLSTGQLGQLGDLREFREDVSLFFSSSREERILGYKEAPWA